MDFEKAYKNLVAKVKDAYLYAQTDSTKNVLEDILPELRESEDERNRKKCIELIKRVIPSGDSQSQESKEILDCIAYLEKQKERKPVLSEEGERIRKEIIEVLRFVPSSIWEQVKTNYERCFTYLEKQKEQKPKIEYVYPKFRKDDVIEPITPNGYFTPVRVVDIYDSSYSCRSDDGNAYLSLPIKQEDEYRLVEQRPTEKQDYSGLNDLERAIHRGFLSAGVENVPVTIIKETAQECLAQMKLTEWSEEDEEMAMKIDCYLSSAIGVSEDERQSIDNWLKSLRPSWKPSEEQMTAFKGYIEDFQARAEAAVGGWNNFDVMIRLYEQLKKL